MTDQTDAAPRSQSDKFKELARELGSDEDEAHWDERLKKLAKAAPAPAKGAKPE